jgi:hypothetical protein
MKINVYVIIAMLIASVPSLRAQEECVECGDSQPPMVSFGDFSGRGYK